MFSNFSKIVIFSFLICFSISSFAKSQRPRMEMLWPHTFEAMSKDQQKEYVDQLRKAWLEFEKKFPQPKVQTASFFQRLLFETAEAGGRQCIICGVMMTAEKKGNSYICPTTARPCGTDGFKCSKVFGEVCVDRHPAATISQRGYKASSSKPLNKEDYEAMLDHLNKNFTNICVKNGVRKASDGCSYLARKFTDITTKHGLEVAGLKEFVDQQAAYVEASKVSSPTETAEETSTATAELPPMPPLLKYGIGADGKVLKPDEARAMMAAYGIGGAAGATEASVATEQMSTDVSNPKADSKPRPPTAGFNRGCYPPPKKGKNLLLPKFDLSLQCAFDNNRALLGSLDQKGCNKDPNMEYLFATRIQSKNKQYINNGAADIISGIIYNSELVERKSPTQATYALKMLTHHLHMEQAGAPPTVDKTYKIEQNGSRYYLVDSFGVKTEVDMQHVWRKTFIEVDINGRSEFGAQGALQSITALGNDCKLVSGINDIKTSSGISFSPGKASPRTRGAI